MTAKQEMPIRDAASLILIRDPKGTPSVLMGQRGARAAFMPEKFVFPGGAVDAEDARVPLARPLGERCASRLSEANGGAAPAALAAAAIRELHEETGLMLGRPARWPDGADVPPSWQGYAARGLLPDAGALRFIFRAITPPGRPRRFDARFFIADAEAIHGDPDDFSAAGDELSALQWIPLSEVRAFNLPFITEVVLAEVSARLPDLSAPPSVPFFDNSTPRSRFVHLGA